MSTTNVAIIGGGLSGLSLALALHKNSIACTVYESRPSTESIGGAIMLSPNALRILDKLGVFARILPESYEFDDLYFRTAENKPLDTHEFGNRSRYGYSGVRVYRHVLIRELLSMVEQARIPVIYGKRFDHIVSETASAVTWAFADGTTGTAAYLVGADGIHSRVRKYLYPDLEPQFTNAMGVTAAIPTSQLSLETTTEKYDLPVTIMNKTHGAFVIAPQLKDGSEVLIGRQKRAPQLDRAGWDALLNDKEWCVEFLRDGASDFPDIVQRAVSHIETDQINLWPFYVVPRLERWSSKKGRVVILGDAAHAIPPTAGQGVNQAFEDVYAFALVLNRVFAGDVESENAMMSWQRGRQERVDRVLELNRSIDKRRMPALGDEEEENDGFDMEWLYQADIEDMIEQWLRGDRL